VENLRGLELARLEDIHQGKVQEHNSCPNSILFPPEGPSKKNTKANHNKRKKKNIKNNMLPKMLLRSNCRM